MKILVTAISSLLAAQLFAGLAFGAGGAKIVPHEKDNYCPETEVPMEPDSRDGITVTPVTQTDLCDDADDKEEGGQVYMFFTAQMKIESDIEQDVDLYFATAKTEEECKALADDCNGYKQTIHVKAGVNEDIAVTATGKGQPVGDAKYACYSVFKSESK